MARKLETPMSAWFLLVHMMHFNYSNCLLFLQSALCLSVLLLYCVCSGWNLWTCIHINLLYICHLFWQAVPCYFAFTKDLLAMDMLFSIHVSFFSRRFLFPEISTGNSFKCCFFFFKLFVRKNTLPANWSYLHLLSICVFRSRS